MERQFRHQTQRLIGMFPIVQFDVDDVDVPSKTSHVSYWDLFWLSSSILMHIIDLGFDLNVAVRYYLSNKIASFVWTIIFIYLPSLTNGIISRRIQHQDKKIQTSSNRTKVTKIMHAMLENKFWFALIVLLQLAPVLRYCHTLKYAWKSKKCEKEEDKDGQRHYYIKMLKSDQDVALLRVFECFIEAAPQQVLQLTLLLKDYHNEINFEFVHQVATIISSLGSMTWAIASYHRSIRLVQQDKLNIGKTGFILQLLWHFCITVSRILSLSIVASIQPIYTGIACICHWMFMLVWIMIDSHGILEFCRDYNNPPHTAPKLKERIYSVLFALVLGIVHIFIYLKTVDGKTFVKHLLFYIMCFIENIAACIVWIYMSSSQVRSSWYFKVIIVWSIMSFILGVTGMIIYYVFFHPTVKRQTVPRIASSVEE